MTENEKDILLKDLCARLPYGIVVGTTDDDGTIPNFWMFDSYNRLTEDVRLANCDVDANSLTDFCDVRPYLFPLSSMTEEQCEELRNLIYDHFTLDDEFNEGIRFKTYGDILVWLDEKPINQCYFIFDYFNKHHFDYRGLIPMELAIDATGLNIYKK